MQWAVRSVVLQFSGLRSSASLRALATNATTKVADPLQFEYNGLVYPRDEWTNITPNITTYLGANKHLQKNHPLSILRQRIVNFYYANYRNHRGNPLFSVHDRLSPVVTVQQNFDNLLVPADHISRAKTDSYYINERHMLRAHTTAHQVDLISSGLDNFLVIGEVYRRDAIDATHYPVFHQVDAVRLMTKDKLFEHNVGLELFEASWSGESPVPSNVSQSPNQSKCMDQIKQPCHTLEAVKLVEHEMKQSLEGLAKDLFGAQIAYRWVDTHFPFTQPSWELEIQFKDDWIEVLGCGIMRNEILQRSGVHESIGYAFGLGLERLAMILFGIPDIRLFWSQDSGFLSQFDESNLRKIPQYKPVSVYPQCTNDLSMWLPDGVGLDAGFHPNDLYDLARSIGGDTIEQIRLIDQFQHPKTGKKSLCFRIVYRHMERTLTQVEVNELHQRIANACVNAFDVKIR